MTDAKAEHFASWFSQERFLELVSAVESRARLVDSPDHGAHHWRLVAWTGVELLEVFHEADDLVILLFSLFHDSQRENEFHDPDHGTRGAALARELLPLHVPELAEDRLEKLATACEWHTSAPPTEDPTLGTCWDSDRLNLWRVGIEPSPSYLSTDLAKNPELIQWALRLQTLDYTWREIFDRYQYTSFHELSWTDADRAKEKESVDRCEPPRQRRPLSQRLASHSEG